MAKNEYNDCEACKQFFPQCPCLTCKNKYKVTGAVPFGRKQFERLYAFTTERADEYHVALAADKMADYKQEEMDARLREIWGSDLQSFYERYPELKRYGYDKPQKGWTK